MNTHEYNNLEVMLEKDPDVLRALGITNLNSMTDMIIKDFKLMVNENLPDITITRYLPVKYDNGSQFVFYFGDENETWVFSTPGKIKGDNDNVVVRGIRNKKNIEMRRCFMEVNKLNDLIICISPCGSIVQRYADTINDFNDIKIKRSIVDGIKKLHRKKNRIQLYFDVSNWYNEIFYIRIHDNKLISDELDVYLRENLRNCYKVLKERKCLIHGDLAIRNIMTYKGEIQFIDWEFLSMGHPMVDIGYFIVSMCLDNYDNNRVSYAEYLRDCYLQARDILNYYNNGLTQKISAVEGESGVNYFILEDILVTILINTKKGVNKLKTYIDFRRKTDVSNLLCR